MADAPEEIRRRSVTDRILAVLARPFPQPIERYPLPQLNAAVAHSPERIATANGIQIAFDEFGNPEDPPLLLVMGLAAQMVTWNDEFCARLAARGFRVIRFDNRDIGRSTIFGKTPAPHYLAILARRLIGRPLAVPYSLADMAADALGLLDALGIRSAHVVGMSMGGMIAQVMAIRSPERVRTLTSIMSSPSTRYLLRPNPSAAFALLTPPAKEREQHLARSISLWRILSGRRMPIDRSRTIACAERVYHRSVSGEGIPRQLAALYSGPSRAAGLRRLELPTLVVHGAVDPVIPVQAARRTARLIPGARLEVIREMGHSLGPPVWERVIELIADLAGTVEAVSAE